MKKLYQTAVVLFSAALPLIAQQVVPTPPDDQVVRIATDLIQVDVTVTNKNGKVVTGLNADEFELYENGKRQEISNFSFVSKHVGSVTASDRAASPNQTSAATTQLTKREVRNTFAIVVDDLNMSFASVVYLRKALKRFVDQQMQPGDLVAIIRTGGGVGALQQFTSDKQLLNAAIDKIRWNSLGASGVDALTAVGQSPEDVTDRFQRETDQLGSKTRTSVGLNDNISDKRRTDSEVSRNARGQDQGIFAQTTLGVIRFVISGLTKLPGRKAMMLFTDGLDIDMDSNKSRGDAVYSYLQDIADLAGRSSVVIYTFDTKGMKPMQIEASDNTYEIIDGHREQKMRIRLDDFRDSQEGLAYLAHQTGGRALLNSDDLNGGIERALDEQAGYYLIGYLPDADTFDAAKRKFNKLEVKVKRPGLNVSYRSGFFSTSSEQTPQLTVEKQIAEALTSPFAQNDIVLNINALYADDAADGPYLRSFLHIDARRLKFHDDPKGWKVASFDVAAVTFGDNGQPAENKESKYTIKAKGATYDTMLERGFVYVLIMPVKKYGVYQYRVAVRDADTGKLGSASQIVEVPNLGKKKLELSSLAVENLSMTTWQNIATGKVGSGPGKIQVPSTLLYDTVLREFKAGSVLRYGFEVYNAKPAANSPPKLETQALIFQNRSIVVEGNVNKVDASTQKDPQRVRLSGAMALKDSLPPGDYVLQLTVFDRASGQTATQLLPFAIVK
jgi:VWFA-related protein